MSEMKFSAMNESEVKNTGSSLCVVSAQVEPEGRDQVEDERRAQRQARCIDKIEPDAPGADAHFFSEEAAYTEGGALNCVFKETHGTKIRTMELT